MIGAIVLGILAGYLGRILTPGRAPKGLLPTMLLGITGSLLGYLVFTKLLHVGDAEMLDLGGLPGAVVGTAIVLFVYNRL